MRTLFSIGQDLLAFSHLVDDNDGELMPDSEPILDEWFSNLMEDQETKLASYVAVVKKLTMEAEFATLQAAEYRKKANAREASVKRLKDRLAEYLAATGQQKAQTADGRTVRIQANSVAPLLIADAAKVPERFLVYPPPVVDSKLVRDAIKDGEVLDFASLGDRGFHLRIA